MKISVTCYYVKATNGTPTHETCWLETSGSKRRPELLFCGEPQKKFISPREDVKKHQWCDIAMIICVHSTGLLLYFLSTVTGRKQIHQETYSHWFSVRAPSPVMNALLDTCYI
ncbi:uncharacterized protein LOC143225349 isoform X3 [Tachypleus tridentatus]|uniref:uncharacterized protein LOC143225349 isoform X3 n=1 Tax=Tachypleus tridentatus TaxID=6853 RepID=UPI003FD108C2